MSCCVPPDGSPLVAVLAAGSASRFGGGKLDAMLAGKRVGKWVLDAVAEAGFAPGVIVTGAMAPEFVRESGWALAINPKSEEGLGTSLAVAANLALAQGKPLLVVLADMPLVAPEHLLALRNAGGASATVWSGDKAGVPAYFPLALLPQLAALSGDAGAGALLSGREDVTRINPPEDMLVDVDTAKDLARAEELLSQRG
jgi:CTP:molybdopterin cytidylyltransferase MocA